MQTHKKGGTSSYGSETYEKGGTASYGSETYEKVWSESPPKSDLVSFCVQRSEWVPVHMLS